MDGIIGENEVGVEYGSERLKELGYFLYRLNGNKGFLTVEITRNGGCREGI